MEVDVKNIFKKDESEEAIKQFKNFQSTFHHKLK